MVGFAGVRARDRPCRLLFLEFPAIYEGTPSGAFESFSAQAFVTS